MKLTTNTCKLNQITVISSNSNQLSIQEVLFKLPFYRTKSNCFTVPQSMCTNRFNSWKLQERKYSNHFDRSNDALLMILWECMYSFIHVRSSIHVTLYSLTSIVLAYLKKAQIHFACESRVVITAMYNVLLQTFFFFFKKEAKKEA